MNKRRNIINIDNDFHVFQFFRAELISCCYCCRRLLFYVRGSTESETYFVSKLATLLCRFYYCIRISSSNGLRVSSFRQVATDFRPGQFRIPDFRTMNGIRLEYEWYILRHPLLVPFLVPFPLFLYK